MNTGKAHVSCCVIGPRFSGGSATAFPLPQPPPQAARTGRLGRGHGVGFALTPAEAGAYYTTAKALSRYSCYSLRKTGFFGPGLSYIGFAKLNKQDFPNK